MFQNLNENVIENNEYKEEKKTKKVGIFKDVFALSNIPIYIISFMMSMVGIGGEFSPFSISLLRSMYF